ncbi:hypothetical protein SAMN06297129_1998 [Pseudooceanicola antarcticus]|uniref:DUF2029 domain-containing protein n=1 Tax=Pseudooceanicola antarcticus TaxID=1247613 RepID=A0A285ISK4_9RHOB|nr:hypothetical protein [Pseudooceanicola antarcticus]PJE31954.1 hypothetical protein CVM39_02320 [Pseudooceanicola antarcticus]SNY50990.1 hypothetical protein SAMN06297129_1998 [Pseudooceanicola antarcticus]
MNRTDTGRFLALLIGYLGVQALLIGLRGGVYFGYHEADMIHLASLTMLEVEGQVAHLDFSTPIGEWSFSPISYLVRAGMGLGQAMLWSQWAVALLIAPALAWICWSRFTFWPSVAVALVVLSLPLALVYGTTEIFLSLSMHYNRWAWALAFLTVPVVLFPPVQGRAGDWADAAVLGLPMAMLVMIKLTYAVALAPACILGLLLSGRARVLLRALILALAVLAGITLVHGPGYWVAYVEDLFGVMESEVRSHPGPSFARILLSPAYTLGTLAGLAAVFLLRAIPGRGTSGLTLLIFLPGFAYIAYQNYGNDPLWLAMLGITLLGLPGPEADPDRERILRSLGAAMLVLIGPVMLNLGYSPIRHALQPEAPYEQVLPGHPDFQVLSRRMAGTSVARAWEGSPTQSVTTQNLTLLEEFDGKPLPDCALETGLLPYFQVMSARMAQSEALAGRMPFVADSFSPHWMFLGWAPLPGGTPWYYSGLPGYENAQHLLVPHCVTNTKVRTIVLGQVDPETLNLVEENELYRLYEIKR